MNMKAVTFITIILIYSIKIFGQEQIYELHMTSDFRYTGDSRYTYVRYLKPYNGIWAYTDFDRKNNKIQTGFYTDSTLAYQTGHNRFYEDNKLVFEGNFENGIRIGWWYFYNKREELSDSLFYSSPINKNTSAIVKKDTLEEHQKRDTSVLVKNVELEAEYPGGVKNWIKHITKTIKYPDLVVNTCPAGTYRSIVQFVVCTDSSLCNITCIQSSHPLLDLQAAKAIRNGENWIPAQQFGRKVKAYRTQPVVFSIEN